MSVRPPLAARVHLLETQLAVAIGALKAAQRLHEQALPKFNFGASALDANAIALLNEVPHIVDSAIRVITKESP